MCPASTRASIPAQIGLDTLWHIEDKLVACVDALERRGPRFLRRRDPRGFLRAHGCSDFLVRWSNPEIATSAEEGKIPKLGNWADQLADGSIGLDSLMNLAGFNSFAADQKRDGRPRSGCAEQDRLPAATRQVTPRRLSNRNQNRTTKLRPYSNVLFSGS